MLTPIILGQGILVGFGLLTAADAWLWPRTDVLGRTRLYVDGPAESTAGRSFRTGHASLVASPDPDPRRPCRAFTVIGSLRCGGQERQLYYLLRSLNSGKSRRVAVWIWERMIFFWRRRALDLIFLYFPLREGPRLNKFAQWRLVRALAPESFIPIHFIRTRSPSRRQLAQSRASILGPSDFLFRKPRQ